MQTLKAVSVLIGLTIITTVSVVARVAAITFFLSNTDFENKRLVPNTPKKAEPCTNGKNCTDKELCLLVPDSEPKCVGINEVVSCRGVKCETGLECFEGGPFPECVCGETFVTKVMKTNSGSERKCHKICTANSDCISNDTCIYDAQLGYYCVDFGTLVDCTGVSCPADATCSTVNNKPKCECKENYSTIGSGSNVQCLNNCSAEGRCVDGFICAKDSTVCVDRTLLDSCEHVRCEGGLNCIVDKGHPICRCPPGLVRSKTKGSTEKICRDACTIGSECATHELCRYEALSDATFCVDRSELRRCDEHIKCEGELTCVINGGYPICDCAPGLVFNEIVESGETKKLCRKPCSNGSTCEPHQLCYDDARLKGKFCVDRSELRRCDEHIKCEGELTCVINGGYPICDCASGLVFNEIVESGESRKLCRAQCSNGSVCEPHELCYDDASIVGIHCVDRSELTGCDENVKCEGQLTCVVQGGYPVCDCEPGLVFNEKIESGETFKLCSKRCSNGSVCEAHQLCYNDDSLHGFYCVDREEISDCDENVKCEGELMCIVDRGYPICECAPGLYLKETANDKLCLKQCTNGSVCEPYQLCHENADLNGVYCVDRTELNECDENIKCEGNLKCGILTGHPICECDTGFIALLVENEFGGIERKCFKICTDGSYCAINELCYNGYDLEGHNICVDQSTVLTCAGMVLCEPKTECQQVSEGNVQCLCTNDRVTRIKAIETGSFRDCFDACTTSKDCYREYFCDNSEISDIGLVCRANEDIESCDTVVCQSNLLCFELKKSKSCRCNFDERLIFSFDGESKSCHDYCHEGHSCGSHESCRVWEACTNKIVR